MGQKTPIEQLEVINMPDLGACYSTIMAFGLTALRGKRHTPRDVDTITGRRRLGASEASEFHNMELSFMDGGGHLEGIHEPGYPSRNLLDKDSTITWSEFINKLVAYYGEKSRHWNEKYFNERRKEWQSVEDKYARHRKAGRYKETEAKITADVLRNRLGKGAFVSAVIPGDKFYQHAVGLYGLDGDNTCLFSPAYPVSPPLEKVAVGAVVKRLRTKSGLGVFSV